MAETPETFVAEKFKEFLSQKFPEGLELRQIRKLSINNTAKLAKNHESLDMTIVYGGNTIGSVLFPSFSSDVISHNNGVRSKAQKEVEGLSQKQKVAKFPQILGRTFEQNENGVFVVKRSFSAPTSVITYESLEELQKLQTEIEAKIEALKASMK